MTGWGILCTFGSFYLDKGFLGLALGNENTKSGRNGNFKSRKAKKSASYHGKGDKKQAWGINMSRVPCRFFLVNNKNGVDGGVVVECRIMKPFFASKMVPVGRE